MRKLIIGIVTTVSILTFFKGVDDLHQTDHWINEVQPRLEQEKLAKEQRRAEIEEAKRNGTYRTPESSTRYGWGMRFDGTYGYGIMF